jgi:hypothetical protein
MNPGVKVVALQLEPNQLTVPPIEYTTGFRRFAVCPDRCRGRTLGHTAKSVFAVGQTAATR